MALYELRTYTLRVGAMAEAVNLYQELGFPAPRQEANRLFSERHRHDQSTRALMEIRGRHRSPRALERRVCEQRLRGGIRLEFRPLVMTQEVKLPHAAPWGPHP
jgi:hypothetical protein